MTAEQLLKFLLDYLIATDRVSVAGELEQKAAEVGVRVDARPLATSALPPTNNINP